MRVHNKKLTATIGAFLDSTGDFDIARSRVSDFAEQIAAVGGAQADELAAGVKTLQRVYAVSTSPNVIQPLLNRGLHSANSIASVPWRSFLAAHGAALGGEAAAFAVHQRAAFISARTQQVAMKLTDYIGGFGVGVGMVMDEATEAAADAEIAKALPNWKELFDDPGMCECSHCRSVYSASAYLVDLLRFLWAGAPNSNNRSPLDVFAKRRPDVLSLLLTCENTNTILPYVDLANEVMERYVRYGSLDAFTGYDTGAATVAELRAAPQYTDVDAYRELADAKYPFTLPYHQPLDVLRTFSTNLGVRRYDVMRALHPQPDSATATAIAIEALGLSAVEYELLTTRTPAGAASAITVRQAYGYSTSAGTLSSLRHVRELLHRSGVSYPELVELIETQFINPYQHTLGLLQRIFAAPATDPKVLYDKIPASHRPVGPGRTARGPRLAHRGA